MNRTSLGLLRCALFLSGGLALGACRREAPKVEANDIERCERGIERAVQQTDVKESLHTYYTECAGIYSEQGCRDAYTAAASLEPSQQMQRVLDGCRQAYCPKFQDRGFDACVPGFQASSSNIMKAWPPLHDAILVHDAKGYAPRISRAMLVFYSRIMQRMGGTLPVAQASAAPPASAAPEGSAAPSASAAPSGSVAPPASASASASAAPAASAQLRTAPASSGSGSR